MLLTDIVSASLLFVGVLNLFELDDGASLLSLSYWRKAPWHFVCVASGFCLDAVADSNRNGEIFSGRAIFLVAEVEEYDQAGGDCVSEGF